MGKRLTFEEIVGTGFRWPMPGDDPFEIPDGSLKHARMANDDLTRFALMSEGYRRSADVLVHRILSNWREGDTLIYPILFLYRHALELHLKYIINNYGHHVGVDQVWNTHKFTDLWPMFLKVLDRFGTDDPDEADQHVGAVIAQFSNLDPGSFSHRYPRDNRGDPIPLVSDEMHLETLKDVMDGVFGYFKGTDGFLSDLVNV